MKENHGFWNNKALNSLQWLGNNSDDDCNIISVHFRVSKWWIATLEKVFDENLFERKQIGLKIQMFWVLDGNKYKYIFMYFKGFEMKTLGFGFWNLNLT